jgi:hypothetical protein
MNRIVRQAGLPRPGCRDGSLAPLSTATPKTATPASVAAVFGHAGPPGRRAGNTL